jgi:hypothetical protein
VSANTVAPVCDRRSLADRLSIHAPARERTGKDVLDDEGIKVSIHAPARERTAEDRGWERRVARIDFFARRSDAEKCIPDNYGNFLKLILNPREEKRSDDYV